jgi:hypothetical protein
MLSTSLSMLVYCAAAAAYQRTMHKLVDALRTSIEAEAGGAKEREVCAQQLQQQQQQQQQHFLPQRATPVDMQGHQCQI